MSTIDCGGADSPKTYPIAELTIPQCIVPSPTATSTSTATPNLTPTPTALALLCECEAIVDAEHKHAQEFLPIQSPTPTPSTIEEFKNEDLSASFNENLISVNYINNPTASSTPAPTPTPIINNINTIEINFVASNFNELHIVLDLINKTININHAVGGSLPLNPVKISWKRYMNGTLLQANNEDWDIPWTLVPLTEKQFLNSFYSKTDVKKRAPFVTGFKQWSNQRFIKTNVPVTDNINIICADIPSNIIDGKIYIDTLPNAANNYVSIIKVINNFPSNILLDGVWSFTVKISDSKITDIPCV